MPRESPDFFKTLELKEYETTALETLLTVGRTTAPNLSEATDIPKARIYGVLESLAEKGYIKIIPGRPKVYQAKPPSEVIDRAIENHRQKYEKRKKEIDKNRQDFLERYESVYQQAEQEITPTEELFYVVDVGEPSESETRNLYHQADTEVNILTKSFEYFESVEPAIKDALDNSIKIDILFLKPELLTPENQGIQKETIHHIDNSYPELNYRFSVERLPWRGTFIDPSMDYESGKAIILVEEKNIPLHMRQAAVTENASFVAGLKRYFDLIWKHESQESRKN